MLKLPLCVSHGLYGLRRVKATHNDLKSDSLTQTRLSKFTVKHTAAYFKMYKGLALSHIIEVDQDVTGLILLVMSL